MHNLSPTHINKNLKKLEDKGFIQRSNVYADSGKHRMIKVNVEKIKEPIVENDKTTYQNRQVPIVENDKTTYQNRQVPIVEDDNTYTKENTKENTKERESMLAYDFLKEFYSYRLLSWEGKYKHQLKDFDKFIDDFNDEVEIDEMDKEPDELFNFMVRYAKGFIKKEPHFDKLKRGHRGQNTN
jgi:DNA-binding MarR family transcriptional regulator